MGFMTFDIRTWAWNWNHWKFLIVLSRGPDVRRYVYIFCRFPLLQHPSHVKTCITCCSATVPVLPGFNTRTLAALPHPTHLPRHISTLIANATSHYARHPSSHAHMPVCPARCAGVAPKARTGQSVTMYRCHLNLDDRWTDLEPVAVGWTSTVVPLKDKIFWFPPVSHRKRVPAVLLHAEYVCSNSTILGSFCSVSLPWQM